MGSDIVFLVPIVALPCVAAVIIAFSPLGRALAARLSGGQEQDPELLATFEEQANRLVIAEDAIDRLEQRVDFQERLLSGRTEGAPQRD